MMHSCESFLCRRQQPDTVGSGTCQTGRWHVYASAAATLQIGTNRNPKPRSLLVGLSSAFKDSLGQTGSNYCE